LAQFSTEDRYRPVDAFGGTIPVSRLWRFAAVKLYRLPMLLHDPSEDTENRFQAEVPALPGCRAWGDTAAGALENLQSVATAFIESYRDRSDALPPEVQSAGVEVADTLAMSEILVAA
jgi:predicted RNase H-like HicB family nuclease